MKGRIQGSCCPARSCPRQRAGGVTLPLLWSLKACGVCGGHHFRGCFCPCCTLDAARVVVVWLEWWPCPCPAGGCLGWQGSSQLCTTISFPLVRVFFQFSTMWWQTKVMHSKMDLGSGLGFANSCLHSDCLVERVLLPSLACCLAACQESHCSLLKNLYASVTQ